MTAAPPTLNQTQAKALAGKPWTVDGTTYRFADYDPREPGIPPWKSGAEGIAYPLLDPQGKPIAYVKFFDELKVTRKRIQRSQWLIGQRIDAWTPELQAASRMWIDTRKKQTPRKAGFDFCCSLAAAVPGRTWLELKLDLVDGLIQLDNDIRRRCIVNFLRGLAFLERHHLGHGDLSPNNVLIDTEAPSDQPALYFIDFDAFFAPRLGELGSLSAAEGGTFGTLGYCPPTLPQQAISDPAAAAPFSDGYARDMLLMEMACFDSDIDFESPPSDWDAALLTRKLRDSPLAAELPHLSDSRICELEETARPSSFQLARNLSVSLPPRIKPKRTFPVVLPPSGRYESSVRQLTVGLWALCILHWLMIAFWFAAWLTGDGVSSTTTAACLRLAARLLLGTAAALGGLSVTSIIAFAEPETRVVNLAGIVFHLPARRCYGRCELFHQTIVAGQLTGMLVILAGCAYLMATAGG